MADTAEGKGWKRGKGIKGRGNFRGSRETERESTWNIIILLHMYCMKHDGYYCYDYIPQRISVLNFGKFIASVRASHSRVYITRMMYILFSATPGGSSAPNKAIRTYPYSLSIIHVKVVKFSLRRTILRRLSFF